MVEQTDLFDNFPMDHKNRPLLLMEFENMPPIHLEKWIRHLASSFVEGSKFEKPFRFLMKSGPPPDLTFVRDKIKMDEDSEEEEEEEKKKGRGRSSKKDAGKEG